MTNAELELKYEFKAEHFKQQFADAPILLRIIAHDFIELSNSFAITPVITRITDPVSRESGVHTASRAIDFRHTYKGHAKYTKVQTEQILQYINLRYERNDEKPTLLCHKVSGSSLHFHLQIAYSNMTYMPIEALRKLS